MSGICSFFSNACAFFRHLIKKRLEFIFFHTCKKRIRALLHNTYTKCVANSPVRTHRLFIKLSRLTLKGCRWADDVFAQLARCSGFFFLQWRFVYLTLINLFRISPGATPKRKSTRRLDKRKKVSRTIIFLIF